MVSANKNITSELPVALYYQLKNELLKKITSKQWLPGEKIPSEKELCQIYGVSRITVRKALDELAESGHLVRRQGKGTFVTNVSVEQRLSKFYSFSEELKKHGMQEKVKVIRLEQIPATQEIADRLEIELPAQVRAAALERLAEME